MIPLSNREIRYSYATHPLEPVDVTKTLDESQSAMYKPTEEQTSVITLECASANGLKSVHNHSNDIKLESLDHNVDRSTIPNVPLPVPSSLPAGVPTSVVTAVAADTWTPLTPPQSTLQ